MLEKLKDAEIRYCAIEEELAAPDIFRIRSVSPRL